jgi:hypothetical protein
VVGTDGGWGVDEVRWCWRGCCLLKGFARVMVSDMVVVVLNEKREFIQ